MPLRRSKSLFGTDKLTALSEHGYMDPISLRKQHLVTDENDDDDEEEGTEPEDQGQQSQVGVKKYFIDRKKNTHKKTQGDLM